MALKGRVEEAFALLDPHHTGRLNASQLKHAILFLTGVKPTKVEVQLLLHQLNSPQGLSREQLMLVAARRNERISPSERIRELFYAFDSKGAGYITKADVLRIFAEVAPHVHTAAVESAFAEADVDGNGLVGYREFERIMTFMDAKQTPQHSRQPS